MGQKDIVEKKLEDYNDVFADIVNVLVFGGGDRVQEDALEDADRVSQYKADDSKLHEQERDVMKYWMDGDVRLAVCGIENQTTVDAKMPVRIFGYEGADYRSQYKKTRISPVVTIVLYYGTENRWDKPVDLVDLVNIPAGLEPYVNNCHANVIDVAWIPDELLGKFRSDFGIVANFFVNKRKDPKYIPDDPCEIKHVDAMLKFLRIMTGDGTYEQLLYNPKFKKEGANMCSIVQNLTEIGREEGREEGLAEGRMEGRAEERLQAIQRFIEKGFDKDFVESMGYSEEEYAQAEQSLLVNA